MIILTVDSLETQEQRQKQDSNHVFYWLNQVQQVKPPDLTVPVTFLHVTWTHRIHSLKHSLCNIGVNAEQHAVSLGPHQISKPRPNSLPSQETRVWTFGRMIYIPSLQLWAKLARAPMSSWGPGPQVLPVWDDLQSSPPPPVSPESCFVITERERES